MESVKLPSIDSLYKGRTVFITGASGCVGKVMVEKMLRSVPGIVKIFVLIRPSRGKTGAERWKQIEKLEIFNRIRHECPDRLAKVAPIEGDISMPDLGISEADLKRVLEQTSMVFHCAATVRFDEPLKAAVEMNMRGLTRVISLCHRMPKMACFLHCSTCYVNSDKLGIRIEEKIYPPACDPHKLIEASEWMSEELFESIGSTMSQSYDNTYCFTKSLAEHIVLEDAASLPTIIFRPAIVGSIWKDGIPGWADAFQGIAAMMAALGSGAISRIPVNLNHRLDAIPVDVVSSSMIVCAAYRLASTDPSIHVVHCNSSDVNPMFFGAVRDRTVETAMKYPIEQMLETPIYSPNGFSCLEIALHRFKEHYVGPAIDRINGLCGKKPFWTRMYARIGETYVVLKKFLTDYHFETSNLLKLIDMMTEEDRETFEIDIRKLDWQEYMFDIHMGIKVFLLKDNIVDQDSIRAARRNLQLHKAKAFVVTLLVFFLIMAACAGSWSVWPICLPLATAYHCYFHVFIYTPRGVGSVHDYRRRVEAVIGEPLKPRMG